MKYLIPIFFLLGSSLFANEKSFDLYFQINYHNSFEEEKDSQNKKYFAPFKQNLATRFELGADLSNNTEISLQINPFAEFNLFENMKKNSYAHCKGLKIVEEAKLNYYVSEAFSFELGCVKQNRGGFNTKDTSDLSIYETKKTELLYDVMQQARYVPAFNFNFDVFGAFTFQILHRVEVQQNLPAMNLQWTMSLLGIEPLLQFGLYGDKMESFHYNASLKTEFEQFTLKVGYFADHNNTLNDKKFLSSWDLYALYENSSWLQPFLRIFYIQTKEDIKIVNKYYTFSFGNKMEIYDTIEPYITFNLIRDEKTHDNNFEVHLGVAATI